MTAVTSRVHSQARYGCGVLLVAGLLCGSSAATAQPSSWRFTKVIAVGDNAPGPEGGTFDLLLPPAVNNRGEVALDGVRYPGGGFDEGVYIAGRGRPVAITRFGRLAPGGGVFGGFGLFGSIGLNDSGDVAFAFGRDPDPQKARPYQWGAGVYRKLQGESLKAVFVPHITPAPGGTTFEGAGFHATLNAAGDVAFAGVVDTNQGNPGPMARDLGLGQGVFVADHAGRVTKVVSPGDEAPGGGRFDYAELPWINDKGDVAFGGHIQSDECIDLGQSLMFVFCATSVYVKEHDGRIKSIAHQGRPAPGGGTYRLAFGPVINNDGDILFAADLTPAPNTGDKLAIFLQRHGVTVPIARPGDRLPGGGRLLRASLSPRNFDLNNAGDVVFDAALDTTTNGHPDNGVYLWSRGRLSLIARTGTVIPGLGVIRSLSPTVYYGLFDYPMGYTAINDRGQVAFQADMFDGSNVVLLATPTDGGR